MSYVRSVLQPNEKILVIGRLHWIVYMQAILLLVVGILLVALGYNLTNESIRTYFTYATVAIFGVGVAVSFLHAWFIRWITEFAVTDRRVIYKCGFISRHTVEMNMDKIESVDVDQSLLGRLLNYGTIHVLGTGEGIESLRRIAAPLALRNAITAK
jgi:Predicted membrane protein